MKTVKTFKYLGLMFDADGGAEKDVNDRIKKMIPRERYYR